MHHPEPPAPQPARVLGLFDATCIVVGAIIGVGIFFNPSNVARVVSSADAAMLAWALAGLIALCGALTFAELGGRYHGNGAQYEILRDAYGPFPAFLFVFCNATAIQAGAIGVIAIVCVKYLFVAAGQAQPPLIVSLSCAVAMILSLIGANIVGVKWGSRIQNLTVAAKVLTLLAVTGLAIWYQGPAPADLPAAEAASRPGILSALVFAFFAYGGWQHSLWIAGEVREPRRNLPRAVIIGVACVIAVYLLANWAYLKLLGHAGVEQSQALAADCATLVLGPTGGRIIAGAVAVSAFGVLNAQLLSGPRLVYGMARDGRFFAPFARLSPTFGTPIAAILLLGLTAIALLVAAGAEAVDRLTTGAVFIDGIFFSLTGLALIILRRRTGPPDGFRVPLYPIVPLAFVLGEFGLLAGALMNKETLAASIIGVGWIIGAALIYAFFFRRPANHPDVTP